MYCKSLLSDYYSFMSSRRPPVKRLEASPTPFLASWFAVSIAGNLHLVGIAANEGRPCLAGWIATGRVIELDFLKRQATTGPDGSRYGLGMRVGGDLTPLARRCIAEMIALHKIETAVPKSALTTEELRRLCAASIRAIGADQYLATPALFELF